MKICAFATTFPRFKEDYLGSFVLGQLRELAKQGHETHVFVPHDPEVNSAHDELHDGVHVHRVHYWIPHSWERLCYRAGIPHNFRSNPLLAIQLPILILALVNRARPYIGDCDILHGHWSFGGMAALLTKKLTGKPMVLTLYGAEIVPSVLKPVNRLLARQADTIIAISAFTGRILQDIVPDVSPHIIPYGYNTEKIASPSFDVKDFKRGMGLEDERPVILAVGRLVRRKGFHILIEAAAELLQTEQAYVLIGGRGPEDRALRSQIDRLNLSDSVRLLGYIDDEELAKWYAAVDIFVLPAVVDESGDTEGLGMVLVEAMINRTPVVGSATGGIMDIVKHEESGLLAHPGDAGDLARQLQRLLTNEELYARIQKGGQAYAETHFSWEAVTTHLLDVYAENL